MIQTVSLESVDQVGSSLPASAFGHILDAIQRAIQSSVRMALEGRSSARGMRPRWLRKASDLRFKGHRGEHETIVELELPSLGESAPRIYAQRELWNTRPSPTSTGLDILGEVIRDIGKKNTDSDRFDPHLLSDVYRFRSALKNTFRAVTLNTDGPSDQRVAITGEVARNAMALVRETPRPQRVRTVGTLDMIRKSTNSFGLRLTEPQEVRGVLVEGSIESLGGLIGQQVLVVGDAIYRPSGRLLRLDALIIEPTTESPDVFSRIPQPRGEKLDMREIHRSHPQKKGVAGILGQWPGDETDEEIERALAEMG